MAQAHRNIHGRKAGRGIRPWLLIPKYLCVAMYLGSLAAMIVIGLSGDRISSFGQLRAELRIFYWVIAPAMTGAVVFGILLLLHTRPLLTRRWLWVKVVLAVCGLGACDMVMHHALSQAEPLAMGPQSVHPHGALMLAATTQAIAIGVGIVVVILGRLKPRLGQKVKTLAEQRAEAKGESS